MTNARFRSLAVALASHVPGTYALIDAVDAVMHLDGTIEPVQPTIKTPDGKATYNWQTGRWDFNHADLVDTAINDPEVMGHMWDNKKILAIKALRVKTMCGLKEAKEAIEDPCVSLAMSDPWRRVTEPPF